MTDEEYKVSELAKLLDLTPETIRYYESVGIVNPRHDSGNRYRYYISNDFSRLYNVKLLRSLGFGLSDIRSFFYEKDNQEQSRAACAQAEALKAQVRELEDQIRVLGKFSEELSALDRLSEHPDIVTSDAFWLVPFRANYSFDMDSGFLEKMGVFLSNHKIPRYSYILRARLGKEFVCDERYVGYSVSGSQEKPADNAVYIPPRRSIRFAYSLIAGERFDDAVKRSGLFESFTELGLPGSGFEMFGHTINISTKDGVTYLNHLGFIPVEGGPITDWDAMKER